MVSSGRDLTPGRFVARRVASFERRDGAVVLSLVGQNDEGVIEDRELTVAVLESGAVRLSLGPAGTGAVGLALDPEPALAPLAVTTSETSPTWPASVTPNSAGLRRT